MELVSRLTRLSAAAETSRAMTSAPDRMFLAPTMTEPVRPSIVPQSAILNATSQTGQFRFCRFSTVGRTELFDTETHWLRSAPKSGPDGSLSSARLLSRALPPTNTFRHLSALAAAFSLALSFCRADEARRCAVLRLTRSAAAMSARLRPWLCISSARRSRIGSVANASINVGSVRFIALPVR
jgi:hypothetical protein